MFQSDSSDDEINLSYKSITDFTKKEDISLQLWAEHFSTPVKDRNRSLTKIFESEFKFMKSLYCFLENDQVIGKTLTKFGIPNICGKINKKFFKLSTKRRHKVNKYERRNKTYLSKRCVSSKKIFSKPPNSKEQNVLIPRYTPVIERSGDAALNRFKSVQKTPPPLTYRFGNASLLENPKRRDITPIIPPTATNVHTQLENKNAPAINCENKRELDDINLSSRGKILFEPKGLLKNIGNKYGFKKFVRFNDDDLCTFAPTQEFSGSSSSSFTVFNDIRKDSLALNFSNATTTQATASNNTKQRSSEEKAPTALDNISTYPHIEKNVPAVEIEVSISQRNSKQSFENDKDIETEFEVEPYDNDNIVIEDFTESCSGSKTEVELEKRQLLKPDLDTQNEQLYVSKRFSISKPGVHELKSVEYFNKEHLNKHTTDDKKSKMNVTSRKSGIAIEEPANFSPRTLNIEEERRESHLKTHFNNLTKGYNAFESKDVVIPETPSSDGSTADNNYCKSNGSSNEVHKVSVISINTESLISKTINKCLKNNLVVPETSSTETIENNKTLIPTHHVFQVKVENHTQKHSRRLSTNSSTDLVEQDWSCNDFFPLSPLEPQNPDDILENVNVLSNSNEVRDDNSINITAVNGNIISPDEVGNTPKSSSVSLNNYEKSVLSPKDNHDVNMSNSFEMLSSCDSLSGRDYISNSSQDDIEEQLATEGKSDSLNINEGLKCANELKITEEPEITDMMSVCTKINQMTVSNCIDSNTSSEFLTCTTPNYKISFSKETNKDCCDSRSSISGLQRGMNGSTKENLSDAPFKVKNKTTDSTTVDKSQPNMFHNSDVKRLILMEDNVCKSLNPIQASASKVCKILFPLQTQSSMSEKENDVGKELSCVASKSFKIFTQKERKDKTAPAINCENKSDLDDINLSSRANVVYEPKGLLKNIGNKYGFKKCVRFNDDDLCTFSLTQEFSGSSSNSFTVFNDTRKDSLAFNFSDATKTQASASNNTKQWSSEERAPTALNDISNYPPIEKNVQAVEIEVSISQRNSKESFENEKDIETEFEVEPYDNENIVIEGFTESCSASKTEVELAKMQLLKPELGTQSEQLYVSKRFSISETVVLELKAMECFNKELLNKHTTDVKKSKMKVTSRKSGIAIEEPANSSPKTPNIEEKRTESYLKTHFNNTSNGYNGFESKDVVFPEIPSSDGTIDSKYCKSNGSSNQVSVISNSTESQISKTINKSPQNDLLVPETSSTETTENNKTLKPTHHVLQVKVENHKQKHSQRLPTNSLTDLVEQDWSCNEFFPLSPLEPQNRDDILENVNVLSNGNELRVDNSINITAVNGNVTSSDQVEEQNSYLFCSSTHNENITNRPFHDDFVPLSLQPFKEKVASNIKESIFGDEDKSLEISSKIGDSNIEKQKKNASHNSKGEKVFYKRHISQNFTPSKVLSNEISSSMTENLILKSDDFLNNKIESQKLPNYVSVGSLAGNIKLHNPQLHEQPKHSGNIKTSADSEMKMYQTMPLQQKLDSFSEHFGTDASKQLIEKVTDNCDETLKILNKVSCTTTEANKVSVDSINSHLMSCESKEQEKHNESNKGSPATTTTLGAKSRNISNHAEKDENGLDTDTTSNSVIILNSTAIKPQLYSKKNITSSQKSSSINSKEGRMGEKDMKIPSKTRTKTFTNIEFVKMENEEKRSEKSHEIEYENMEQTVHKHCEEFPVTIPYEHSKTLNVLNNTDKKTNILGTVPLDYSQRFRVVRSPAIKPQLYTRTNVISSEISAGRINNNSKEDNIGTNNLKMYKTERISSINVNTKVESAIPDPSNTMDLNSSQEQCINNELMDIEKKSVKQTMYIPGEERHKAIELSSVPTTIQQTSNLNLDLSLPEKRAKINYQTHTPVPFITKMVKQKNLDTTERRHEGSPPKCPMSPINVKMSTSNTHENQNSISMSFLSNESSIHNQPKQLDPQNSEINGEQKDLIYTIDNESCNSDVNNIEPEVLIPSKIKDLKKRQVLTSEKIRPQTHTPKLNSTIDKECPVFNNTDKKTNILDTVSLDCSKSIRVVQSPAIDPQSYERTNVISSEISVSINNNSKEDNIGTKNLKMYKSESLSSINVNTRVESAIRDPSNTMDQTSSQEQCINNELKVIEKENVKQTMFISGEERDKAIELPSVQTTIQQTSNHDLDLSLPEKRSKIKYQTNTPLPFITTMVKRKNVDTTERRQEDSPPKRSSKTYENQNSASMSFLLNEPSVNNQLKQSDPQNGVKNDGQKDYFQVTKDQNSFLVDAKKIKMISTIENQSCNNSNVNIIEPEVSIPTKVKDIKKHQILTSEKIRPQTHTPKPGSTIDKEFPVSISSKHSKTLSAGSINNNSKKDNIGSTNLKVYKTQSISSIILNTRIESDILDPSNTMDHTYSQEQRINNELKDIEKENVKQTIFLLGEERHKAIELPSVPTTIQQTSNHNSDLSLSEKRSKNKYQTNPPIPFITTMVKRKNVDTTERRQEDSPPKRTSNTRENQNSVSIQSDLQNSEIIGGQKDYFKVTKDQKSCMVTPKRIKIISTTDNQSCDSNVNNIEPEVSIPSKVKDIKKHQVLTSKKIIRPQTPKLGITLNKLNTQYYESDGSASNDRPRKNKTELIFTTKNRLTENNPYNVELPTESVTIRSIDRVTHKESSRILVSKENIGFNKSPPHYQMQHMIEKADVVDSTIKFSKNLSNPNLISNNPLSTIKPLNIREESLREGVTEQRNWLVEESLHRRSSDSQQWKSDKYDELGSAFSSKNTKANLITYTSTLKIKPLNFTQENIKEAENSYRSLIKYPLPESNNEPFNPEESSSDFDIQSIMNDNGKENRILLTSNDGSEQNFNSPVGCTNGNFSPPSSIGSDVLPFETLDSKFKTYTKKLKHKYDVNRYYYTSDDSDCNTRPRKIMRKKLLSSSGSEVNENFSWEKLDSSDDYISPCNSDMKEYALRKRINSKEESQFLDISPRYDQPMEDVNISNGNLRTVSDHTGTMVDDSPFLYSNGLTNDCQSSPQNDQVIDFAMFESNLISESDHTSSRRTSSPFPSYSDDLESDLLSHPPQSDDYEETNSPLYDDIRLSSELDRSN